MGGRALSRERPHGHWTVPGCSSTCQGSPGGAGERKPSAEQALWEACYRLLRASTTGNRGQRLKCFQTPGISPAGRRAHVIRESRASRRASLPGSH